MLTSSSDGIPVLEPKNLVRRRFVMTLGVAAVVGLITLLLVREGTSDRVLGGGSTVAQPLIQRAAVDFQNALSGDTDWVAGSSGVEYEPVGSLGGIMRLQDPEVDFAIADYPLSPAALREMDAVQFPILIGSISVVYNAGEASAPPLRFTRRTLSGIFSGRIAAWDDPAIAADNPGVTLPTGPITVVHRDDGSGSTLNWSTYLARDEEWKDRIGAGTTLNWPVGVGIRGGGGMARAVAQRPGAIGYLETGQARRAGLATGLVENEAGAFVAADEENVIAAARGLDLAGGGMALEDAPEASAADAYPANAYPVVSASYVVMKRRNASAADNARTLRFLAFLLDQGAETARGLGYLPLAPADVAAVREVWARELGFTAAGDASGR